MEDFVYLVIEYNSLTDNESPIEAYRDMSDCAKRVQELNQKAKESLLHRKFCEACPLYDLSLDMKDAIKMANQICKDFKFDSKNEDCLNTAYAYDADCTYRLVTVPLNK